VCAAFRAFIGAHSSPSIYHSSRCWRFCRYREQGSLLQRPRSKMLGLGDLLSRAAAGCARGSHPRAAPEAWESGRRRPVLQNVSSCNANNLAAGDFISVVPWEGPPGKHVPVRELLFALYRFFNFSNTFAMPGQGAYASKKNIRGVYALSVVDIAAHAWAAGLTQHRRHNTKKNRINLSIYLHISIHLSICFWTGSSVQETNQV